MSREQQMTTDTNRAKEPAQDTQRHWLVLFEYVWQFWLASVGVFWFMAMSRGCLGDVLGCLRGVWGCLRVSECYFWKSEALRCVLGSQPLQYGAITLFWHCPERHDSFAPDHSETLKYQNVYIWGWQKWLGDMISLFFNARQNDIKNGSCKWSPCSN